MNVIKNSLVKVSVNIIFYCSQNFKFIAFINFQQNIPQHEFYVKIKAINSYFFEKIKFLRVHVPFSQNLGNQFEFFFFFFNCRLKSTLLTDENFSSKNYSRIFYDFLYAQYKFLISVEYSEWNLQLELRWTKFKFLLSNFRQIFISSKISVS